MRYSFILILSIATLAALAAMAACTDNRPVHADSSSVVATVAAGDGENDIDSLSLRATLMNTTRAYAFALDGEQCYFTLTASAEWPREIGGYNLAALTDTLVAAAFPLHKGLGVEAAMTAFLSDTTGIINAPAQLVAPASVPDTTYNAWSLTTRVERKALTDGYVTYFVTSSSYLGGAHPNTVITPVTYDLRHGCAVTPSTLFAAGSEAALLDIISTDLANDLGCKPGKFTSAGLFNDTLTMPSGMYIDGDGLVVFQYGQYEIGPYAMGIIKVSVTPYELRNILTPAGRELLADSL